jgi:hypothetical protein
VVTASLLRITPHHSALLLAAIHKRRSASRPTNWVMSAPSTQASSNRRKPMNAS